MARRTKHILITTENNRFQLVQSWCNEKGLSCELRSFIDTKGLKGLEIPKTEWIFFSSPRGAYHFLSDYGVDNKKIAALGPGTAAVIQSFGLSVNFVGSIHHKPKEVGITFEKELEFGSTVLFPISQISKKSVLKAMSETKTIALTTYKTVYRNVEVTIDYDLILFTSPSNFKSYISTNIIHNETKCIAFGKTTEDALLAFLKPDNVYCLEQSTPKGFIEFLENQLKFS